jgi:hypothetical protein
MIGFLVAAEVKDSDTELYFKALRLAQIAIDLEPERYKHYFLNELPERYHGMVDVRTFGIGERLVFEPYTREMFERTHRWMVNSKLFPAAQSEIWVMRPRCCRWPSYKLPRLVLLSDIDFKTGGERRSLHSRLSSLKMLSPSRTTILQRSPALPSIAQ